MAIEFIPKTWKDRREGGTPIIAAELNRIEQGIAQLTEMLNKVKDYAYSAPIANLLTTEKGFPLDASMGRVLDSKNTELTNDLKNINISISGLKIIKHTYRQATGTVLIDCFPTDGWYWIIGSIGLSNVIYRNLFEVVLNNPLSIASLNVLKAADGYISLDTKNNMITAVLSGVTDIDVNVQAICIPYFE